MRKSIILINRISENPTEDELDVLHQAEEVENTLKNLNYEAERIFTGLNLEELRDILTLRNPDLVFNLVEGLDGKASLIHLAPALLQSLRIPFTGCRLESMFSTSNKLLAKKILQFNKINTPEYFTASGEFQLDPDKTYIAKPVWEDASVGITDKNIFKGSENEVLQHFIRQWGDAFFVEEYISGREFNVAVLGGQEGPEIMPLAEMTFLNFPEDKPKIVGYPAKWEQDSFEYLNTIRTFEYRQSDLRMREAIQKIALECWNGFELTGYSRIDIRVDENNTPFVLEINANPCLSKDAGFFAACEKAGLRYEDMVRRIIYDAYR